MHARFRHLFWIGALSATCASAHSLMPNADWCANGKVETIGEFDFPGASLQKIDTRFNQLFQNDGDYCSAGRPAPVIDSDAAARGGAPGVDSCGVVDNHWNKAARIAWDYCAGLDPSADVIPIVTLPSDYYADGHHQRYQLNQGLHGRCVRCVENVR
jgi:hypothetical protein